MSSHACKWLIDSTSWFTFIVCTVWLEVINSSKCQEFSMPLYSNMDHRNDVKMFKTHVKPQAAGEWFHWKGLDILTSFLWSRSVQTMESYCRFVFYHNIDSFDVYFCWTFSVARPREKEKNKLRHHHVISTLCTLNERSSRPISVWEIAQSW